jgi:hypothetical protein
MRYAVTLWFIDRVERDRRILLDQKENEEKETKPNQTTNRKSESNSSNFFPLVTTQCEVSSQSLPQLELISNESISPATHIYRIKYPDERGYQATEVLVTSTKIILKAEDNSFETFHLVTTQPIVEQNTVAKYHKKSRTLSLTVQYVSTS